MPYHRSEEHTSELQSHDNLVCRLLLEKKKIILWYSDLATSNSGWWSCFAVPAAVACFRAFHTPKVMMLFIRLHSFMLVFFLNKGAPPEIPPLPQHDALPS